jgi:hypothetical protein
MIFFISIVLQIIVGRRYADQCPINWRIPHYLVVAGAVAITLIVFTILQAVLAFCCLASTVRDDDEVRNADVAACCGACGAICSIGIVAFFLVTFLFAWFIAGCVWVFGAWNKVQHKYPNQNNYCHPTLFRFAFWLLILSILCPLFICLFFGIQLRKQCRKIKTPASAAQPTKP